jgi:hypothetical protein
LINEKPGGTSAPSSSTVEGGKVPTGVGVIASVAAPVVAVDGATGVSVGDDVVVGVSGEEVAVLVAGLQAASTSIVNKKNRINTRSSDQNCTS